MKDAGPLLCLAGLAACGAPAAPQALPPSDWQPSARAASPAAGGAGPRVLDLAEVMRLAGEQALDPRQAEAGLAAAEADVRLARAAWTPELAFGARFWRNEGEVQSTEGLFLDVDKQNTFLGAEVGLRLDLGAALFAGDIARAGAGAARSEVDDARLRAVAVAVDRYLDLVEAELLVGVADSAVAHARDVVAFEASLVERGRGTPADLARVEAHLASARAVRRAARMRGDTASVSLGVALALEPGERPQPASLDLGPPPDLEPTTRRQPALEAAEQRVRAAQQALRAADQRWLWPTLELVAASGGFGRNLGGLDEQTVLAAGVTWRLGAGFGAREDRARAELHAARLAAVRVHLDLEAAEARARIRLQAAGDRLELARQGLEASTRSADLARQRHEAGRGVLLEALEAEVERVRAAGAVAAAQVELHRALNSVRAATGFYR